MIRPTCAYRFQLTPDDTFGVAAAAVPYLASLGVSHLYLSPIAEAEQGSRHGYDIVDPTRIRAEIGGEAGFSDLIRTLEHHGMGWILDIVPNHMSSATPEANPWWWDVLKLGQRSHHARSFDIDWDAADGKILLPVLTEPVDRVIANGAIVVVEGPNGEPCLELPHGLKLPLDPKSNRIDAPVSDVLDSQNYRLVPWQSTARNVRRFFEIDSLVAVAIENSEVRDARHQLLRRLISEYPSLAGVRVDHVDGLADPDEYLEWLRQLIGPDRILLVEKIVLGDEQLPRRWPVDGTTGYEFARLVDRLLLNEDGFGEVVQHYQELTNDRRSFAAIEDDAIHEVLTDRLAPDAARIAGLLSDRALPSDQGGVDAVVHLAGAFRRYRTYLPHGTDADVEVLEDARGRAIQGLSPGEVQRIDALMTVLTAPDSSAERKALELFQQLTGPALAKGIEDRAIYRYAPLAALNEVGATPTDPAATTDDFRQWAADAADRRPRSMLTTSTHDTKRSGDVRARLLTLSDHPTAWRSFCDRWIDLDADSLPVHRIDRYFILQHVVGAWPISVERLVGYVIKALREGAERTSWINQDERYESAVAGLIESLLSNAGFARSVEELVQLLAQGSLARSLSQTILRLTSPGFADLYRGDEIQDLSLVDPDNRRPLDWDLLAAMLEQAQSLDLGSAATASPGLAKLTLIIRTLAALGADPAARSFEPLAVHGPKRADDILAFRNGSLAIVVDTAASGLDLAGVQLELPTGTWSDVLVDEKPTRSGLTSMSDVLDPQLPLRVLRLT